MGRQNGATRPVFRRRAEAQHADEEAREEAVRGEGQRVEPADGLALRHPRVGRTLARQQRGDQVTRRAAAELNARPDLKALEEALEERVKLGGEVTPQCGERVATDDVRLALRVLNGTHDGGEELGQPLGVDDHL